MYKKCANKLLFCAFFCYFIPIYSQAAPIIDNWPVIHSAFFAGRSVENATNQIVIDAPEQAENAAIVPFSFAISNMENASKSVYIFIDANPITHTATLHLPSKIQRLTLSTRIRLENNSYVRVIAETDSGQLFMKKIAIKTPGGGCGGGVSSDEAALRASAGKIKLNQQIEAENSTHTLNIKHPMRTGFERTAMGYYAKAWFINQLKLNLNGITQISADLGPGISADPYFKLQISPSMQLDSIEANDNESNRYEEKFSQNIE